MSKIRIFADKKVGSWSENELKREKWLKAAKNGKNLNWETICFDLAFCSALTLSFDSLFIFDVFHTFNLVFLTFGRSI